MIEIRRLHRQFGSIWAVNDISFEVPSGQVFGYIGPNGAGKTTSMRILATLDNPTFGDALVDGYSVIKDPDRVRRRLGFMPDAFGTYPNVNCFEYLDFFARAYGLSGSDRRRALDRVLAFTGLDELSEKPIRGLSKGMKQRLCLGRALIHDPPALVLDEPAAGLDPRARIELRDMINHLAAIGKSILISSHILTELAEMCDRVAIIERGRLLVNGTVEEIRKKLVPNREVKIQVLGDTTAIQTWLGEQPGIGHVLVEGDSVRFAHNGTREDEAEMLRAMILAGLRIAEFGSHITSLEEVFMRVTKGEVQ
jgi:ABC-2 type transport system ATP-binding protein